LDRRLTRSQADPDMQRLLSTAIPPLEQLLRQHRTRHGRRRGRERDEQPVTGVLEHPAARRIDRLTQQGEVLIA
jgi:hypothetical protein